MLFIVVVLLGVFFAMGYIVGRSALPTEATAAKQLPEAPPTQVEPETPGTAQVIAGGETGKAQEGTEPSPEAATKEREAPPPANVPAQVTHPAAPAQTTPPKPAPARPGSAGAAVTSPDAPPPPGFYYQVAATTLSESEILADVLKRHTLPARLAPVPGKDGIYRVLVGPLEGNATIANAKDQLDKAGFRNYIGRRF